MHKRKKPQRKTSREGRLNAVKKLLQDKNVRELIIQIILAIIETMKR